MSTDDFNICTIYGPNIYVKSIKFYSQILQRRSQELPFGCTKVRRVVWGPPQAPIGSKAGSGRGKGGFRSGVLPVKYLKVNLLIFFSFLNGGCKCTQWALLQATAMLFMLYELHHNTSCKRYCVIFVYSFYPISSFCIWYFQNFTFDG